MYRPALILILFGSLGLSLPCAAAIDPEASFIFDLPVAANLATPIWLGHPVEKSGAFAELSVPISPSDPGKSLLISLIFDEQPDGFLRLIWEDGSGSQTLTENFEEGIAMGNQRSLIIPADLLRGGGKLRLQSDHPALGVRRIKFEWLQTSTSLISPAQTESLIAPELGAIRPISQFDGAPPAEVAAAWSKDVVNVPIAARADRIEQGVEYPVVLDLPPTAARLVFLENGLPLDRQLAIWVNGELVATVLPAMPSLSDPGYFRTEGNPLTYIGWREASCLIPTEFLKIGTNAVQIALVDREPKAGTGTLAAVLAPLAIKTLSLELLYATSPPAPSPPAPAPSAVTTLPDSTPRATKTPVESAATPLPTAAAAPTEVITP